MVVSAFWRPASLPCEEPSGWLKRPARHGRISVCRSYIAWLNKSHFPLPKDQEPIALPARTQKGDCCCCCPGNPGPGRRGGGGGAFGLNRFHPDLCPEDPEILNLNPVRCLGLTLDDLLRKTPLLAIEGTYARFVLVCRRKKPQVTFRLLISNTRRLRVNNNYPARSFYSRF